MVIGKVFSAVVERGLTFPPFRFARVNARVNARFRRGYPDWRNGNRVGTESYDRLISVPLNGGHLDEESMNGQSGEPLLQENDSQRAAVNSKAEIGRVALFGAIPTIVDRSAWARNRRESEGACWQRDRNGRVIDVELKLLAVATIEALSRDSLCVSTASRYRSIGYVRVAKYRR